MHPDTETARASILVVEDDPAIQFLLKYHLKRHYVVELTASVDAALAAASRQSFDLFLIDINLGEARTGIDLLALLREMPAYGATPAVVCSAYISKANRNRYIEQGFEACVIKPFTAEELLTTIHAVLSKGEEKEAMAVSRRAA